MIRGVSVLTPLTVPQGSSKSTKALQSETLKGKHILEGDMATQHNILSHRNATMQNASPYRLLYVQINSHFVYMEPLGEMLLFPPNKTKHCIDLYINY